jgi:hypothetical protein
VEGEGEVQKKGGELKKKYEEEQQQTGEEEEGSVMLAAERGKAAGVDPVKEAGPESALEEKEEEEGEEGHKLQQATKQSRSYLNVAIVSMFVTAIVVVCVMLNVSPLRLVFEIDSVVEGLEDELCVQFVSLSGQLEEPKAVLAQCESNPDEGNTAWAKRVKDGTPEVKHKCVELRKIMLQVHVSLSLYLLSVCPQLFALN